MSLRWVGYREEWGPTTGIQCSTILWNWCVLVVNLYTISLCVPCKTQAYGLFLLLVFFKVAP